MICGEHSVCQSPRQITSFLRYHLLIESFLVRLEGRFLRQTIVPLVGLPLSERVPNYLYANLYKLRRSFTPNEEPSLISGKDLQTEPKIVTMGVSTRFGKAIETSAMPGDRSQCTFTFRCTLSKSRSSSDVKRMECIPTLAASAAALIHWVFPVIDQQPLRYQFLQSNQ